MGINNSRMIFFLIFLIFFWSPLESKSDLLKERYDTQNRMKERFNKCSWESAQYETVNGYRNYNHYSYYDRYCIVDNFLYRVSRQYCYNHSMSCGQRFVPDWKVRLKGFIDQEVDVLEYSPTFDTNRPASVMWSIEGQYLVKYDCLLDLTTAQNKCEGGITRTIVGKRIQDQ